MSAKRFDQHASGISPEFFDLILSYCPGCGQLRVVHRGLAFCECEGCVRLRDRLAGESRLRALVREERRRSRGRPRKEKQP